MVRRARRRKLTIAMNPNHPPASAPASAATEFSPPAPTAPVAPVAVLPPPSCGGAIPPGAKAQRVIKLGVDVHWREHVVVRQIDGTAPEPAQRFAPEAFVAWGAEKGAGGIKGAWVDS